MTTNTAAYLRISTTQQNMAGQKVDLERWIELHRAELGTVHWYQDEFSGKAMSRPGWNRLQRDIESGLVGTILVWRLDRLGRSASGLTSLFDDLIERKVRLVCLAPHIDLGTSGGRLIANVIAAVAQYETELRAERVKAGQEAAKASGKKWGGSRAGRLVGITKEQAETVIDMHRQNMPKSKIAKSVGIDRSSVYRLLARLESGDLLLDQTA